MDEQESRIDLNTATVDELSKLPGIGTKMAQRIVAARPFDGLDDVSRVTGIGNTVIDQIEAFVVISPARPEGDISTGLSPDAETPKASSEELQEQAAETDMQEVESGVASQQSIEEAELGQPLPTEEEDLQAAQITEAEPEPPVALPIASVETTSPEPVTRIEEDKPAGSQPEDMALTTMTDEKVGAKDSKERKPESEPSEVSTTRQGSSKEKLEKTYTGPGLTQVWGIALFSGFLSLVLSIAVVFGLLVGLNGGLQFVRPDQLTALQQQAKTIEVRSTALENDIQGLRTRIDNLEGLSGRVSSVEKETTQIRAQIDTLTEQANQLNEQVDRLSVMAKELQVSTRRFQLFLDGLRDLLNANQP